MEDLKNIEELLRKYYNGETSLEEERKLHWFFQTGEVPSYLHADAELFRYHYRQRKEEVSPKLEEKLGKLIHDREHKRRFLLKGRTIRMVSGIAATILIALTLWIGVGQDFFRNRYAGTSLDTYDDPQLAYLEAKKVLIMVSEKLNAGTKDLQYLKKYDQGVNMLEPVLSFGSGVQPLEKLTKFNEATELIIKKQK